MNLREIITDALKYPISDTRNFLIFCVLIVIMTLSTIFPSYGVKNETLSIFLTIVSLIVFVIILGYLVEVIKLGIEKSDVVPEFDYVRHFVIGVKSVILDIVYLIIPLVLVILVASATGLFTSFTQIVYTSTDAMINGTTNLTTIMAIIPKPVMTTFTNALTVTVIVGIVFFVLFSFLSFTGLYRFAKYGSGTEGLRFMKIIKDIMNVGLGKIVLTLVVIYLIAFALLFAIAVIGLIPYIGVFIGIYFGLPFIFLFVFRAIGLMYSDA